MEIKGFYYERKLARSDSRKEQFLAKNKKRTVDKSHVALCSGLVNFFPSPGNFRSDYRIISKNILNDAELKFLSPSRQSKDFVVAVAHKTRNLISHLTIFRRNSRRHMWKVFTASSIAINHSQPIKSAKRLASRGSETIAKLCTTVSLLTDGIAENSVEMGRDTLNSRRKPAYRCLKSN